MRRWKRKLLVAICALIVVSSVCIRTYLEFVPRGAAFFPFIAASHQLADITSPSGRSYQLYVNDAGAMHSGNYWTWVVDRNWLQGQFVVTEGYITLEYSTGDSPLIVNWNGDIPVIDFEIGRY